MDRHRWKLSHGIRAVVQSLPCILANMNRIRGYDHDPVFADPAWEPTMQRRKADRVLPEHHRGAASIPYGDFATSRQRAQECRARGRLPQRVRVRLTSSPHNLEKRSGTAEALANEIRPFLGDLVGGRSWCAPMMPSNGRFLSWNGRRGLAAMSPSSDWRIGDQGRDVIGLCSSAGCRGVWDNYQRKHYEVPLSIPRRVRTLARSSSMPSKAPSGGLTFPRTPAIERVQG